MCICTFFGYVAGAVNGQRINADDVEGLLTLVFMAVLQM